MYLTDKKASRQVPLDRVSNPCYTIVMAKKSATVDLEQFAKTEVRPATNWCVRTLPEEILEQVRANYRRPRHERAPMSAVLRWLHSLGYPEASKGKLETFLRGGY